MQLLLLVALVSGLHEEESVSRSDPWDSDLRNPGEGEDGSQWASLGRREKSLANTFPFNLQENVDLSIQPKQGVEEDISFAVVASSVKRCIDKVVMEEMVEWENVVTCDHSYNKRCHTSQVTVFNAAQEEECEENFVKNCFIEYGKFAFNDTVKVCRTGLVKDCNKAGEEICSTQYESECVTSQEKHEVDDDIPVCETIQDEKCEDKTSGYTSLTDCSKWPREVCSVKREKKLKFSPVTQCSKVPVTLCGPAGCGFKEGEEVCEERSHTVVLDRPEENCSLDPQKTCKHVTKLVPVLKAVENCVDVPKEVCTRSQRNPRTVARPVVKTWCYGSIPPTQPPPPSPPTSPTTPPPFRTTPPTAQTTTTTTATTSRATATTTTTTATTTTTTKTITTTSTSTTPGVGRTTTPPPPRTTTTTASTTTAPACPNDCLAAAARGECPAQCERFNNPLCCSKCPAKCVDEARYGFCSPDCRQYAGDPNCCAPKCPPKCTNRRRDSCAAGGVSECSNVPGCCPDHFDELYGAVDFQKGREKNS